ncbi:MAG: single-stranded-DNA-specific exonuclease RecJ [Armatimonadota bacterium]|nr:single-stranded-DNA-specific exonuclease RecJ [Armatimonadota bacterium]MCX7777264.1 single-stranded-DNA-specific exonuclease RecJ [Armatimonadota bacterium]MDW8024678.1 single-stranded-DNA-specific exonuclease RecJ [Armatimonadota bacterium]
MAYAAFGGMAMRARWELKTVDERSVECLSNKLSLPRLLARILCSRGFSEPSSAMDFIKPSIGKLYDPFLMADMSKAAKRVFEAIRNREGILVHGDYDADGICAAAMLSRKLSQWGAKVYWFIPDRFIDGYGVSMRAIRMARSINVTLMLTCDCGTAAHEKVELARRYGIDTIIVDHHEPKGSLPTAYAVLNPKRADCEYPFRELSATGVAFKLLCAIADFSGFESPIEDELCLDLVGIATVADVVPLIDENRVLGWHGLSALSKRSRVGLRKLMECASLRSSRVTGAHVSFIIAPRLNAAGRLANARDAVKLLLTEDEAEAGAFADRLEALNRERQEEEERTLEEAIELIESDVDVSSERVIVLAKRGWHQGVIGIVASKIVELYHRPAILIAIEGDFGKGSARSIHGFNITEALGACRHLLTAYGGHSMAAGFTVRASEVSRLRRSLNEIASQRLTDEELTPKLRIDAQAHPKELSQEVAHGMLLFEPCGCGNPKPLLALLGAQVIDSSFVGGSRGHLKLLVQKHGEELELFGFRMRHVRDMFHQGQSIDLCFTIDAPVGGSAKPSLRIKSLRESTCEGTL